MTNPKKHISWQTAIYCLVCAISQSVHAYQGDLESDKKLPPPEVLPESKPSVEKEIFAEDISTEIIVLGDDAKVGVRIGSPKMLRQVQFDDVTMAEAMKVFADETGLNIINSAEAGKTRITAFLKKVTAMDALDAIVKSNGLFYRKDEHSGIIRIATSKEYERDLSNFREEETKVFTLLYPNPDAVAQVVQQILGNRVQYNAASSDQTDLADLSQRFSRFDLVDGRALGLGALDGSSHQGSGANRRGPSSSNSMQLRGSNGFSGSNGLGGGPTDPYGTGALQSSLGSIHNRLRNPLNSNPNGDNRPLNDLSSEEIQRFENQLVDQGRINDDDRSELLERKAATIYVSTIRRNNQIIVRTGDLRSMEQIEHLIAQLDVPTPTVLLEVKVLRVHLTDGLNSAFEYFAKQDGASVAFSDGNLSPNFPGGTTTTRSLTSGVAGKIPGALSFQMVDDNFQFRMQLLQSKNRVTALATPLILTANNEVSRIFVGDTLPFTVGFTPSQLVGGVNAVNGAVAATPITELRDVGQSLLITPNINADRTVTLRVVEENSERILSGASIPIPAANGDGISSVNVDTVRRRTVSGTIVAQDGMAVAMGGLIEEQVNDSRDQIPILGELPGVGFLFRRQSTNRIRTELVVVIRPYVFNTPSESAAASHELLNELSLHPTRDGSASTMNTFLPWEVVRADPECCQRANLFRLHNVVPKN